MNLDVLDVLERSLNSKDAVTAFRRFILQLALRGGLVPRNLAEGDARALLSGEPGNPEIDVATLGDFGEFEVPSHWVWVQVRDIGRVVGGGTPPSGDAECFAPPGSDIAWLTPADLGQQRSKTYVSRGRRDITARGLSSSSATLMPAGTVLFTSRAPIGYVAIAEKELTTNQGFKSVIPSAAVMSGYVALYFRAFGPLIDSLAPGTTFREVSGKVVAGLPFPLPPLEEQRRVVAKVDELMTLCDALEVAQTDREARRDLLRTTSLRNLIAPDESKEHVRFFLHHSPRMITKPEHVASVRQAILDLAVRGRLVPQDPVDEPAAVQYDRIALDRKLAIEAGTVKPISHIPDSVTRTWSVPRGWLTVPLPAAVYFQEGPGLRNWQFRAEGIPFLNIRTLQNGRVKRELCQFLDPEEVARKYSHFLVREGDILCSTSGTIGKLAVAAASDLPLMLNTSIVRFAPYGTKGPARGFIELFLRTRHFLDQAHGSTTGSAQVNMGPSHLKLMAFPLPPLPEQHRIVAKVDELLAVFNELEQTLATEQTERARLLEALLLDALEDPLPARD